MATGHHDHLRETAIEALAPEEFDRLVASISDARRLGRLRYWQEQLLARIPGRTVGFEEFIAAFDGAPLQRPKARMSYSCTEGAQEPAVLKTVPRGRKSPVKVPAHGSDRL